MEYFIVENGKQAGPFTIAQLAERHIKSETLVWKEGMTDWTPAWKVAELKYILAETHQQTGPAVPPVPPTANQDTESTQQPDIPVSEDEEENEKSNNKNNDKKPKKKSSGWKIIVGLLVVLMLILAFTNPGREDHEQAVKEEVSKVIDKAISSSSDNTNDDFALVFEQGLRSFAKMFSNSMIDVAFDQLFEYHNYIIFSKGTINFNDKIHSVSFGILGQVFTINADDAVKAMENVELQNGNDSSENADDNQSANNSSDNTNLQSQFENKTNEAIDKLSDKVSKKVEDKLNKKLEELNDSSNIDKIVDKILSLF